ncbi:MAG: hypothetical protein IKJ94_06490 [Oscillospiraceae bacterium]|nr:hypothetical protein [Oscillospiraceae bacterium]
MKKITTMLCAAFLMLAMLVTASAASNVSVSISRSKKSINAGDKVTITVSGKAKSCNSGGVEVSFNSSVFELVSGDCVVSGAFMKDFNAGSQDGVFAFDSASDISGNVLKFVLKAKSNAPTGKYNVTVKFKADSTTASATTTVTIACEHSYSNNCDESCNKCGATREGNHSWGSPTVLKEADCQNKGSAKYACTNCGETKTEALAKADHTYDHNCDTDCNVCGAVREVVHTFAWAGSETEHWQECVDCKVQQEKSAHTLAADVSSNETGHGYACTVCLLIPTAEAHTFDSVCDDSCDACGYTRTVYHSYSGRYTVDEAAHWNVCVLCGAAVNTANHTPGTAATQTTDMSCTACGYILEKAANHIHIQYDDLQSDANGHWYACRCGENSETVAHNWDSGAINEEIGIVTYVCADCGYQKMEAYEPEFVFSVESVLEAVKESPLMMIFALSLCGAAVIIIALVVVLIVLGVKNRRLKKSVLTIEPQEE